MVLDCGSKSIIETKAPKSIKHDYPENWVEGGLPQKRSTLAKLQTQLTSLTRPRPLCSLYPRIEYITKPAKTLVPQFTRHTIAESLKEVH